MYTLLQGTARPQRKKIQISNLKDTAGDSPIVIRNSRSTRRQAVRHILIKKTIFGRFTNMKQGNLRFPTQPKTA